MVEHRSGLTYGLGDTSPLILKDGDPRLHERCKPWVFGGGGDIDGGAANELGERRELAELLNLTMRKAGGVGLAAPQIGIMRRVFCIALGPAAGLVCFNPSIGVRLGVKVRFTSMTGGFNPSIGVRLGARKKVSEGCLSYPGVFLNVYRSEGVKVRFTSMTGAPIERNLWGREAHAYQHELDHLDGRTLPDFVPAHVWERERLLGAMRA
jgi:peptide deformylase